MKKNKVYIAALQAAAKCQGNDLFWLDFGVEFAFRDEKYSIYNDGELLRWDAKAEIWDFNVGSDIGVLVTNTSEIKHCNKPLSFTLGEIKQANDDMKCSAGFVKVRHDEEGMFLISAKDVLWRINSDAYPALKINTEIDLEQIANIMR